MDEGRKLSAFLKAGVRQHYGNRAEKLVEFGLHWSERAAKLEALIRNPNLRPGAESWEEVRQVREFAHHVDDILIFLQDVLMPPQARSPPRRRVPGRARAVLWRRMGVDAP